jgi:hypothetical protein
VVGEEDAILEVLEEMQSLTSEDLIGKGIGFSIKQGAVHAAVSVHRDEIVPNFRRKQLASGKLSQTKMPIGEFNEIYHDCVASASLRVAGDVFQFVPIAEVYVTCAVEMLNPENGHMEETPILSVRYVRETFENLNLSRLDPSQSLNSFVHNMVFSRTKSFSGKESL